MGAFWRPKQRRVPGVIQLTPNVSRLIISAGGPTFFSISGGRFRCNQTNQALCPNQVEGYDKTIFGLANTAAATDKPAEYKPIAKVMVIPDQRLVACPYCAGKKVPRIGYNTCGWCQRDFKVYELPADSELAVKVKAKAQRAASMPIAKVQGCSVKYTYCPHCDTYIYDPPYGVHTCSDCGKQFRVVDY
jgi:hypothetical protein